GPILAAGIPIGLALLCKPLVGFVFFPIAAVVLIVLARPRLILALVPSALIAAAIAAPWHISMYSLHGHEFVRQYFGAEIADRATGALQAGHKSPIPPWFYVLQILRGYWPWL